MEAVHSPIEVHVQVPARLSISLGVSSFVSFSSAEKEIIAVGAHSLKDSFTQTRTALSRLKS